MLLYLRRNLHTGPQVNCYSNKSKCCRVYFNAWSKVTTAVVVEEGKEVLTIDSETEEYGSDTEEIMITSTITVPSQVDDRVDVAQQHGFEEINSESPLTDSDIEFV